MELTTPFNTTTIHGLAEYHQYMHRRSVQLVRTNNRVSQRSREMAIMGLLDEAHEWYREMREQYPRGHGKPCLSCGDRPVLSYYGQRPDGSTGWRSNDFCRKCEDRINERGY